MTPEPEPERERSEALGEALWRRIDELIEVPYPSEVRRAVEARRADVERAHRDLKDVLALTGEPR